MTKLLINDRTVFHTKRIHKISGLKLRAALQKKNPYLFKAKYLKPAREMIFDDQLEGLSIFIDEKVFVGRKYGIVGRIQ
ncbi:MAG: hypothetical protein LBH75_00105 [Treponema sp.]|jgi:hypothetical protein|nr:hypothetical protein [Treponema sp.]